MSDVPTVTEQERDSLEDILAGLLAEALDAYPGAVFAFTDWLGASNDGRDKTVPAPLSLQQRVMTGARLIAAVRLAEAVSPSAAPGAVLQAGRTMGEALVVFLTVKEGPISPPLLAPDDLDRIMDDETVIGWLRGHGYALVPADQD